MNVLELFSGIGGMHYALKESKVPANIIEAVDINTVANKVYAHNFPNTKLCQSNVQAISSNYIDAREINLILMSPPCQPFTRQGKRMDVDDERCAALLHFINLIPHLNEKLKYILLENVEGFQESQAHQCFIHILEKSGFHYKEFLLSPKDFGFPNSRLRYYLLARRKPLQFTKDLSVQQLREEINCVPCIGDFLEIPDHSEQYNTYLLNDEVLLKRARILDIVTKKSQNSCCFTRAYSHFMEGTGSVYCPFEDHIIQQTYEKEKESSLDCNDEKLKLLRTLRLRFFTPREVANLLCFPETFSFPNCLTLKQKYRLLGNSINIKVVARLIQLLVSEN
ncbi:tRNA (cytosine(38)-C(5))-methyltransferase isoform X1 [Rhodnius prolixus]|uniref:tRNA (cytosine(38)-C(5))-methyltransferase n=2 Tax=Rhodnius TaxID=13248 RepID=A0A905QY47_RHOPR